MSNKGFDKLMQIDQELRRAFPVGPAQVKHPVTIRMVQGFEMFNTRPYHNYETWSTGWEIEGGGVGACEEDLDDALGVFLERLIAHRAAQKGNGKT